MQLDDFPMSEIIITYDVRKKIIPKDFYISLRASHFLITSSTLQKELVFATINAIHFTNSFETTYTKLTYTCYFNSLKINLEIEFYFKLKIDHVIEILLTV